MDFQADLPVFHGPLDLLLYLVKRDELDLRDIPIARLAEQFSAYLDVMEVLDVEMAGEFLVMAATLMELKSKVLLPRPEETTETEEDPRQELVRQLLEYKRFKEAATLLEHQAEKQASRLPRIAPPPPTPAGPAPLRPVELWDLVSAFGRLLRETLALQPQQITVDQTPMQVYMEEVAARLQNVDRLLFSMLFTPPFTRSRLVGYFLAILELTRRFRVQAEQDEAFGDIWLCLLPDQEQNGTALSVPPADEG
jgi:segregation and condensation protein A